MVAPAGQRRVSCHTSERAILPGPLQIAHLGGICLRQLFALSLQTFHPGLGVERCSRRIPAPNVATITQIPARTMRNFMGLPFFCARPEQSDAGASARKSKPRIVSVLAQRRVCLVRATGVEPVQQGRGILSPLRLQFRHAPQRSFSPSRACGGNQGRLSAEMSQSLQKSSARLAQAGNRVRRAAGRMAAIDLAGHASWRPNWGGVASAGMR